MTGPFTRFIPSNKQAAGFTIIELLVVLSILGVLFGAIIANFQAQRIPRALRIAQNELVTNIRKIQSYTFSSRNTAANQPVSYYVLKVDTTNPHQYILQAILNADTQTPKVQTVETITLPLGVRFAAVNPILIKGFGIGNTCALLAFKLPYGKVIMNDGCSLPSSPTVTELDDYGKIISFISAGFIGTTFSDVPILFRLTDETGTLTKTVTVSGTTGAVTFQ